MNMQKLEICYCEFAPLLTGDFILIHKYPTVSRDYMYLNEKSLKYPWYVFMKC